MPTVTRFSSTAISFLAVAAATTTAQAETLQQALARAYESNPVLTGARAELRATNEGVPLAKAEGRPDAGINGTYSEELHRDVSRNFASPVITTPKRNLTASGSVNVPLYQGGVVRNAIKSAKQRVEAGQNTLRGVESSVFASVVAAYLDVIRDSAIVTLNEQNVKSLEVNLQASSDRFEVGDLTRTDVAQSDSRLALAKANLESSRAQLIASKERYTEVTGSPPDNLQNPPPLPGLPESPEAAVQVALSDNPDLMASKDLIRAAHYDTNSAEGRAAPRVSAFVNGGYVDYLGSEKDLAIATAPSTSKSASAGVQVTIPIYQGGQPGALARQNAAREAQAIERSTEVERSVIAQTRSTYASWKASVLTIESTRTAVDSASLSLEGVRAENSAGTRTILDILDSQRDLLNAQVQFVTAQRDAYVAAFSLLAAMGHAEARDLNLEGAALYDPDVDYKRVRNKLMDFDFPKQPKPVATTTAQTPAQTSEQITPPVP